MQTAATDIPARTPPAAPAHYDRVFYGGVAAGAALIVLAGFAPTYYLRLFDGGPRATVSGAPFTRLVHLHGALFTAWVALFVVQTALVSARRTTLHRKLGVAGVLLAAAMVAVGTGTAIVTAGRAGGPGDPLGFLAIPLADMIMFTTFVTVAMVRRRDKESHKRLMLLAYASLLAAPFGRMSLGGPPVIFALALSIVFAGMIYDYASRRRIHNVYLWGGAFLILSVPARLVVSNTAAWHRFAQLLTR